MTRVPQRAFSGGILSPGMYPRRDIPKWGQGLKDAANIVLRAEGGAQSRAGTMLAGGYDNSTGDGAPWLIPFEASQDDTYMLEFGEQVLRIIKDGAYVLDSGIAPGTIVSVTEADPARLEMDSSGSALQFTIGALCFVSDPDGTSVLHNQIIKVTGRTDEFLEFTIVGDAEIDTTTGDWGEMDGATSLLYQVYEVVTPYEIEDMPELQFAQDVDTMVLAREGYDPRELVRVADDDWSFTTSVFEPEIETPDSPVALAQVGSGSTNYEYVVTAVSEETGEESNPTAVVDIDNDLTTSGNKNRVAWTLVAGADYYRVYKADGNGTNVFGFIGFTATTNFFDDENITPDLTQNPPTARDPFDGSGDEPAVAAFVEQRLALAATSNNPQVVEMSSSQSPFNFNRALTPGASDAVSFRMRAQQLNRVYHMIEAERPLILTAGGEWYMETENNAPIAQGNFALRNPTHRGSARTPRPILVGANILHVDRSGNTVREFSLDIARDTASADLTLLARHLFRGKQITSIAYAQSPDSVVWMTLATGELYSLTYLSEHEVWGWTRHELGGTDVKVKQVAVVTEGAYDTPYFVVERTLFGETVTLVERLDTREFDDVTDCYFVDCGFRYDGSAAQTLRGYLHLRGEDVAVLADGNVLESVAVNDQGVVDLGSSYSEVSIGLGYDTYIITLDGDLGDQIRELGSSLGRFISADEVAVKVVDTRGIAVGLEGGTLNPVKDFSGVIPTPLATTTHVLEIDGDWAVEQAIEVRQTYPLPMTITAIGPSWSLGE